MAKWIEEIEICTFIYILYAVAAQLDDMGIMPNSEENSLITYLPVKDDLENGVKATKAKSRQLLALKTL